MTSIPLVYSFWFMLVAYVIHIIDESVLGGSFEGDVLQTLLEMDGGLPKCFLELQL